MNLTPIILIILALIILTACFIAVKKLFDDCGGPILDRQAVLNDHTLSEETRKKLLEDAF